MEMLGDNVDVMVTDCWHGGAFEPVCTRGSRVPCGVHDFKQWLGTLRMLRIDMLATTRGLVGNHAVP